MADATLLPWPLFGYAPGNYSGRCYGCDKITDGVDKHAISCLECAVLNAKTALYHSEAREARQPQVPAEDVERLVQDAYEEGVEDGIEWGTGPTDDPAPQWIDSVARVELLKVTALQVTEGDKS